MVLSVGVGLVGGAGGAVVGAGIGGLVVTGVPTQKQTQRNCAHDTLCDTPHLIHWEHVHTHQWSCLFPQVKFYSVVC